MKRVVKFPFFCLFLGILITSKVHFVDLFHSGKREHYVMCEVEATTVIMFSGTEESRRRLVSGSERGQTVS